MRQKRLHHAHVRDRIPELSQRLDELLPLFHVAGPAHDHHYDRLPVQFRRDERQQRARPLLRKATGEVAHRRLVRERDDGSFGAGFEHRLDILRRNPWDHT